jgi:hypothetical protein
VRKVRDYRTWDDALSDLENSIEEEMARLEKRLEDLEGQIRAEAELTRFHIKELFLVAFVFLFVVMPLINHVLMPFIVDPIIDALYPYWVIFTYEYTRWLNRF